MNHYSLYLVLVLLSFVVFAGNVLHRWYTETLLQVMYVSPTEGV